MYTVQAREDVPGPLNKWYRHISKGAWPFSTRDHGWPISDCTSEGALLVKCSHMLKTPGRVLCTDICTASRASFELRHVCRQHVTCWVLLFARDAALLPQHYEQNRGKCWHASASLASTCRSQSGAYAGSAHGAGVQRSSLSGLPSPTFLTAAT